MTTTTDTPAEPYYQRQAKDFIDTLHDRGYLNPDVKRSEMQQLEDLLAYFFQSQCDMAAKSAKLLLRAKAAKP